MAKVKEKPVLNPINGDQLSTVASGTLLRAIAHKTPGVEINQYFIKTNDESYPVIELGEGRFYDARNVDLFIFIEVTGQLTLQN